MAASRPFACVTVVREEGGLILYVVARCSRSTAGPARWRREKGVSFFSASQRAKCPRWFAFSGVPLAILAQRFCSCGIQRGSIILGFSVVGNFRWPVTILIPDLRILYSFGWRGGGVIAFSFLSGSPPYVRPGYLGLLNRFLTTPIQL